MYSNSPFKNGRLSETMSTLAFHLLTICDEKAENKEILVAYFYWMKSFAGHTLEKQYQIIAL